MIYIYTGTRKRALEKYEQTTQLLHFAYMQQGKPGYDDNYVKKQIDKFEYLKAVLEDILNYETT